MSEKVAGVRSAEAEPRPQGSDGPGARPGQRTSVPGGGRSANARPGDSSDIVGDPIGRDRLMVELAFEMIPYTPEELIAIARKEMAWCEEEMKKASRDLGYGDDWHKALEHVKTLDVDPGKQPHLIRDLALEAITLADDHSLVPVRKLAPET